jgi:hypothetical protein
MGQWTSDGSQYIDHNVQLMGSILGQTAPSNAVQIAGRDSTNLLQTPSVHLLNQDNLGVNDLALIAGANQLVFNGLGLDRVRNNTQGTLLASQARTGTTSTPIQTNYNARGVIVTLNITVASGTGGLQVGVQGIDPASNALYAMHSLYTAKTSTGMNQYIIYPAVPASVGNFTQAIPAALPRAWQVTVYAGDATTYTYSLGYALIL